HVYCNNGSALRGKRQSNAAADSTGSSCYHRYPVLRHNKLLYLLVHNTPLTLSFVSKSRFQFGLGDKYAVNKRTAIEIPDAAFAFYRFRFNAELISGEDRFSEFCAVDAGKIGNL